MCGDYPKKSAFSFEASSWKLDKISKVNKELSRYDIVIKKVKYDFSIVKFDKKHSLQLRKNMYRE